jgi:hypothetical protein
VGITSKQNILDTDSFSLPAAKAGFAKNRTQKRGLTTFVDFERHSVQNQRTSKRNPSSTPFCEAKTVSNKLNWQF